MNRHLLWIWCITILLLVGLAMWIGSPSHAQSTSCWPEMERVHTSMEDLQRVRVSLEHTEHLLEDIRAELRKKK